MIVKIISSCLCSPVVVQSAVRQVVSHLVAVMKEYAQAEEVLAGFGVDLVSASDLSHGIGVSETAEYFKKVQSTSAGPYVDLVPGENGTGMCLTRADT